MALRQLEKALEATLSGGDVPEDALNAFFAKNTPIDASTSAKLHDELAKLAATRKEDLPAPFLQALVRLSPYILSGTHLKWWFARLAPIAVDSGGYRIVPVRLSREFLLSVMSGEPDDDDNAAIARENARAYLKYLVDIYVGNVKEWLRPFAADGGDEERRRFVQFNCRNLLLDNIPKNIEDTLMALNAALVEPLHRLVVLQVLSEMAAVRQSSKLFKIVQTPVLENLLRTLEYDNLETSLAIASTTLAMVLPHISDKLSGILPRLYACFGRLCSWQPEKFGLDDIKGTNSVPTPEPLNPPVSINGWTPLTAHNGGTAAPETNRPLNLDPLFMFLYGIFPNNTLAFCRNASDYLENHHYQRPFTDFWDRLSILHRTEELFPHFALNPLLLTLDAKEELASPSSRWESFKGITDIMMKGLELMIPDGETDGGAPDSDRFSDADYGDDEERLQGLLDSHQRLFQETLSQISSAPLLGPVSNGDKHRAAAHKAHLINEFSLSPYRWTTANRPQSLRATDSAQTSPALTGRNVREMISRPGSPLPSAGSPSTQPMLNSPVDSEVGGVFRPLARVSRGEGGDLNIAGEIRARSHSQPLKPAMGHGSEGTSSMVSGQSRPEVSHSTAQGSVAGSDSGSISSPVVTPSGGQSNAGPNNSTIAQYFLRELLLSKNELDFANFSKYIVERKLIKLQKQLAELDIANIRLEFVAGKNRRLAGRVGDLEQENIKSQKLARTVLNQRTAYETSLIEKSRELKSQLAEKDLKIEVLKEELNRVELDFASLVQSSHEREAQIAEVEVELTFSTQKLDALEKANEENSSSSGSHQPNPMNFNGSGAATTEDSDQDLEFEEKYETLLLQVQGDKADHQDKIKSLNAENERLRQQLRENEGRTVPQPLPGGTQRVIAEIQERETERYDKLREAHEDLVSRYNELERELAARRAHEEERMNELRVALMSARPFSFQDGESKYEPRVRGRGGAQKASKRAV